MTKKKSGRNPPPVRELLNLAFDTRPAKEYLMARGFGAGDAAEADHYFGGAVEMATDLFVILDSYLYDREAERKCLHPESTLLAFAILTAKLVPARLEMEQVPIEDPKSYFEAAMLMRSVPREVVDKAVEKKAARQLEAALENVRDEQEDDPDDGAPPPREKMH